VSFERLPDIRQINGEVTQEKIDHQAVDRKNLKSGTKIGKNNSYDHG
jgi:hypothetical protein